MAPEDGEWIRGETASPAGRHERGADLAAAGEEWPTRTGEDEADPAAAAEAWLVGDEGRPGEAWPEGGWLDEDGPDEDGPDEDGPDEDDLDDEWPGGDWPPGSPGPPPETGKRWGHGGVPGFSVWMAAAVAVLAAAAGVAVGLLLINGISAAGAAGAATPSTSASGSAGPTGNGTSLPALPGAAGNGKLQIILAGRVLAVSATSITIGGDGGPVTAAVTSATRVTGTAHGIAGVKAGDEVAARLSGTPGHLIADAIQDPAQ
jgi:hypothetical protein